MELVYSHSIIKNHLLYSRWASTLPRVSEKDYPREKYFTKDIPCLDLDAYEESLSGENDCTMDTVVGVAEYRNNRVESPRMALIELRMDYKNTSNLDFTNISRKVRHSHDLLAGCLFHNKDYFIFTKDVVAKATYEFNRHRPTHLELKNAEPISVEGFKNQIKNIEDYPYQPINSDTQILASLSTYDYNVLIERLDYWMRQIQCYIIRYEWGEAKHILEVIKVFLLGLKPIGDFTQEYIDLYLEEVYDKISVIS